jgi:hypothetical protein
MAETREGQGQTPGLFLPVPVMVRTLKARFVTPVGTAAGETAFQVLASVALGAVHEGAVALLALHGGSLRKGHHDTR